MKPVQIRKDDNERKNEMVNESLYVMMERHT